MSTTLRPRKPRSSRPDAALSFRARLEAEAADAALRKGARTDLRIRAAACELLETVSPDSLKIQELCALTGIAQGTLYQYYSDRDDLLSKLLQDFVAFLHRGLSASTRDSTSPEASVRLATLAYCRYFEANPGLMRCLLHRHEAFPRARAVVDAWNREWIETIVAALRKRARSAGAAPAATASLRRCAYALGGMVDQYLASVYLYRDPNIVAVAGDVEAIAETLTFIWAKALDLRPAA